MIIILDKQRRIEFANESFCRLSGYALDEVLGRDLALFFPPGLFQDLWQEVFRGQEWHGELQNHKKNGERYEALVSISAIRNGTAIENFVIVQEDITALKQAQRNDLELKLEQERVQMLETFVADIGHEFKTPLSIISTGNYLLNRLFGDEKAQKYYQQIAEQVVCLNQMLDEILDLVKLGRSPQLDLEALQLDRCVRGVVDELASGFAQKQIQCQLGLDFRPTVVVDQEKLSRAIRELVQNAIQYTPSGGKIQISLKDHGSQVGIVIQDTGMGIPAADVDHIFEHFYRVDKARSTRGTGLGLSIAKSIIEAHQGEITVESVLGQGSSFEILLLRSE